MSSNSNYKRKAGAGPEKAPAPKKIAKPDQNGSGSADVHLGALKYIPHAIFKLLENIPQPWESEKEVRILRHTENAITFINEIPKSEYTEYFSQWAQTVEKMRLEQQDRAEFRRMRVPAFDDEEPVHDYRKLRKLVPKPPVPIQFNQQTQSKYDQLNAAKECFLPNNIQNVPPFMDFSSLITSKSLPAPLVPFGPVFKEPKKIDELPPSSVDNPDRIILRPRQAMRRPESRIAYPRLYGGIPELPQDIIAPAVLNYPANALITRKDGRIPFFVDKSINDSEMSNFNSNSNSDLEICSKPFLSTAPAIPPNLVAESLALYNAPYPFNKVAETKARRQDVVLAKRLYTNRLPPRSAKNATRSGYKRLLKRALYRRIQTMKSHGGHGSHSSRKNLLHFLSQTPFFEKGKSTWLETGLEVCKQGHKTLLLMIHKRGLHFIHLDYNFNLKPTRTLSTKERKRSRFGHSFHIVRELLRLLKLVVDCHVQFKLGNVDAYELADGLAYIFSNVGQLTGIYRYKYKVMHQITECTDLKNVICDKLQMPDLGCGVWQPMWRVWISFVRGIIPMLERWLGNLLSRQIYGRVSKGVRHTVTKQRIDSQYDLELRAAAMYDILDAMPVELRKSKSQIVMQHLSEAWRCWKADVEYDMSVLPSTAKTIVDRYIKARSENWMRGARITRDKIQNLGNVDSAIARKNVSRLTRLYMREQRLFNSQYTSQGPSLSPQEAVSVYKTMAEYVQQKGISRVDFPETEDPLDTSFLAIAIDRLRNEVSGAQSTRLTRTQQESIQLLDKAADAPYETLNEIKRILRTRRVFSNIEISLRDDHTELVPVYEVPLTDKLTDAYLAQYIWYNVKNSDLFPAFVKPCDEEMAPITARRFCEGLNDDARVWETNGAKTILMHANIKSFVKNVDLTLLNKLLRLVLDPTLADYMTSRMNVSLNFKDMSFVNHLGIITGIPFAPFMIQYYLLAIDLLLLGLPRVLSLDPNQHPIRSYLRYMEDVYIVIHLTEGQCEELIEDYMDTAQTSTPYKRCWPINLSPRLVKSNTVASKCVCQEFSSRLPPSLGLLDWVETSCLSAENPVLHFELAGFEIRLTRTGPNSSSDLHSDLHSDSSWLLIDSKLKRRTGLALLRVSDTRINQFAGLIRQVLMSSGSSSFQRIVERWNRTVTAFVSYFREAVSATPKALSVMERCELQVQNKIKMALNSKMPTRFPPCVFYTSTELGGLGMLSVSKVIVPEEDSYIESYIPNVLRYIRPWETEIADSERAWKEFRELKLEADQNNESLDYESVEHLVDRGLPRIGTLFSKDRNLTELDTGFRTQFKCGTRRDLFYWTNRKHDGKLYDLENYRNDVLKALGGVNTVLGHTLFSATGFESYESLFWQKQSALEQQLAQQKLTNAQRTGMSQIPNRRFTLWWSPTINRANVYVGFLVQLDLTGIFLHGKIPTLKVSYVQLFRAHLWQKIHESVVLDLCRVVDKESVVLHVDGVQKLLVHPRKSYRMNASAADILITSAGTDWSLSRPSLITEPDNYDENSLISKSQFWIDVQLKYGDFDAHDTAKYARAKFLDYTNDGVSLYPSKFGLIVCIDLAYNTYSAYGYWFPGLKQLLQAAMKKIMQSNAALYVLRERIRRALQLHSGKPTQSLPASDFTDLCNQNTMLIDASAVYNVRTYRTKNGNTANRPEDGFLVCFQPTNGIAKLTFIPSSTWAGQKRLSAVSKWKSAELTADVIRKMETDKPSSVIINTPALKDPFEVNMLEFENMGVSLTDMHLPLTSVLKLQQVSSAFKNIDNVSDDSIFTINLYDDWLLTLQPHTAFARLMLVLRGLECNSSEIEHMFSLYPKDEGYIWPKLSSDAWIELEERITDLVINDYAQSHGIKASSLTPLKIRDVILGKKIDDEVIEQLEKLNSSATTNELEPSAANVITNTVESHNIHGDRITVVTSSVYEQQQFNSQTSWQARALVCTNRSHILSHVFTLDSTVAGSDKLVWSQNLLDEFVAISDIRNTVMALAYAKKDQAVNGVVKKVECLALIPQLGSRTQVSYCTPVNTDPNLELVGYIRMSTGDVSDSVPPLDLSLLSKLGSGLTATVLCYEGQNINVQTYKPSEAGLKFGKFNKDLISPYPSNYSPEFAELCRTELDSTDSSSYFLVPDDGVWNYAFISILWNEKIPAIMKIANPVGYYDSIHRPNHFLSFQRLETVEDCNPLDTENEFD